jgi:16S rRNA (adenine1518-N6/adenine1519-N6)-dimethyltransferase
VRTQVELLRAHGIRPKARLGQNFLVDPPSARRVVARAAVSPEDVVVELGAGLGAITSLLAEAAREVHAIERDGALARILRSEVTAPNVRIHHGDLLDFDFAGLATRAGRPLVVVGDIPYNITTDVILTLLRERRVLREATLMVQREFGDRLRAKPGTKAWSALSVRVQLHAEVSLLGKISRNAFHPKPEVDSVLVRLVFRKAPAVPVADEALFARTVRASFGMRRKTLANALADGLGMEKRAVIEALRSLGIDPGRRGETLTLVELAALSEHLTPPGTGLPGRAGK